MTSQTFCVLEMDLGKLTKQSIEMMRKSEDSSSDVTIKKEPTFSSDSFHHSSPMATGSAVSMVTSTALTPFSRSPDTMKTSPTTSPPSQQVKQQGVGSNPSFVGTFSAFPQTQFNNNYNNSECGD